jgi:hypothetical protein
LPHVSSVFGGQTPLRSLSIFLAFNSAEWFPDPIVSLLAAICWFSLHLWPVHKFTLLYNVCVTEKTMKIAALFLSLFASVSAIELTPETWDEATAGKTIFVKFLAPW